MTSNERKFASSLVPGEKVNEVYVIGAARRGEARNGPFWSLVLQDASGSVEAKIWSPASHDYDRLDPGMLARVQGSVQTFRDSPQINVERLAFVDPNNGDAPPMSDLMPASEEKPEIMYARLMELCRDNIRFPGLRKLVLDVLEDKGIKQRLMNAPGAKNVHHAYLGGLLEHTLSVAGLCLKFCEHYPELDREVLIAAAAFHDLGKAWELSGGLANDYTDEGRLLGHISIGMEKLAPFFEDCLLEPEIITHIKHIILSHHGLYEYGSPRRPKTAEAMALHYADNLDAKMNQFAGVFAALEDGVDEESAEGVWSPYQRTLERYLYKPRRSPNSMEAQPETQTVKKNGKNGKNGTKDAPQSMLPLLGE